MVDKFDGWGTHGDDPATNGYSVTPSDVADLAIASRFLWIGTPGNITVDLVGGDNITLASVSGVIPIRVQRVYATGTTATDIVGLY